MLIPIVVTFHVILSLALIALILLHRGTSGGLSDMFGGGATAQLRGSAVVEKNLDRLTIAAAIAFTITTVILVRAMG